MIKGIIQKYYRYRHVAYACLIALFLSICGYFTNNWPILTGKTLSLYTTLEWVKDILDTKDDDYSGALFINTSMDKQIIDIYDSGVRSGNTEITDRRKILEFLKLLEQTDYKYIVIDIRFAEGLTQDSNSIDKALAEKIKSMKRCVVATHRDIKLFGGLESKAALADYKSTVTETNFTRYEYFDSIPSIPLHVYNELQKEQGLDTINYKHASWSIFNEGYSLCQNTVFLKFSSKGFPILKKQQTEFGNSIYIEKHRYLNLGHDFVDHLDKGQSPAEMREQLEAYMKQAGNGEAPIVFIGNIQEDLHDTYAGLQPGVIILYQAIKALQEGKHKVKFLHALFLFVIYVIVSLLILKDKSIMDFFPRKLRLRFPFFFFISKFITLTTILLIVDIVDIKYFGITTNFIIAVILLNTIKLFIQFKKLQEHE